MAVISHMRPEIFASTWDAVTAFASASARAPVSSIKEFSLAVGDLISDLAGDLDECAGELRLERPGEAGLEKSAKGEGGRLTGSERTKEPGCAMYSSPRVAGSNVLAEDPSLPPGAHVSAHGKQMSKVRIKFREAFGGFCDNHRAAPVMAPLSISSQTSWPCNALKTPEGTVGGAPAAVNSGGASFSWTQSPPGCCDSSVCAQALHDERGA